jgi:hypothetical protein
MPENYHSQAGKAKQAGKIDLTPFSQMSIK